RLAQPPLVGVADDHRRPLGQQPAGGGRADAGAGGRGDDGDLAGEQVVAGRLGGGGGGGSVGHRGSSRRRGAHRGSRGGPRALSPMMFRWIALEPAEMVSARLKRNSRRRAATCSGSPSPSRSPATAAGPSTSMASSPSCWWNVDQ